MYSMQFGRRYPGKRAGIQPVVKLHLDARRPRYLRTLCGVQGDVVERNLRCVQEWETVPQAQRCKRCEYFLHHMLPENLNAALWTGPGSEAEKEPRDGAGRTTGWGL